MSICRSKCRFPVQSLVERDEAMKKDTPKGASANEKSIWDWTPRQYLAWCLMWATLPLAALLDALGVL